MNAVSRETGSPDQELIERVIGAQAALAYRYAELLVGPGVERGLLGPREAPRVWDRHILNCAVVAHTLPERARVCDLGSGAGLPGVVLAIARPDVDVTLLEPLLRRATFLGDVVEDLGLTNARVHRGRAEEMNVEMTYDVVTARAVAPLSTLAGWALPLVRAGGHLLALKGSNASEELDAARQVLRRFGVPHAEIELHGVGMVEPPTTVVRIESSGRRPASKKGPP